MIFFKFVVNLGPPFTPPLANTLEKSLREGEGGGFKRVCLSHFGRVLSVQLAISSLLAKQTRESPSRPDPCLVGAHPETNGRIFDNGEMRTISVVSD